MTKDTLNIQDKNGTAHIKKSKVDKASERYQNTLKTVL